MASRLTPFEGRRSREDQAAFKPPSHDLQTEPAGNAVMSDQRDPATRTRMAAASALLATQNGRLEIELFGDLAAIPALAPATKSPSRQAVTGCKHRWLRGEDLNL